MANVETAKNNFELYLKSGKCIFLKQVYRSFWIDIFELTTFTGILH